MDTVDKATRSRTMAAVRSSNNRSTEWKVRSALIRSGLKGWIVRDSSILGQPDFTFPDRNLAIFVDGCFWHGCPECRKTPSSNTSYWAKKIQRNLDRDKEITAQLRRRGWSVMRIWEHELCSSNAIIRHIRTKLRITPAAKRPKGGRRTQLMSAY
jgi:DNA mismatch endonuclease (patch repair protein)